MIAMVALCLTALVGVGASGGGGNADPQAEPKTTYTVRMVPGGYYEGYSDLSGPFFGQWQFDLWIIVNVGSSTGSLTAEIEDCCILGDSMVATVITTEGHVDGGAATSPALIYLGPVSVPRYGWAAILTAYWFAPGGYPAGYYVRFWM